MENEKEKFEDNEDILRGVTNQIASFDTKAGILISVIGIIFALSLSLVDVAPLLKQIQRIIISSAFFSFCRLFHRLLALCFLSWL